jgi:predicted glycosyltransferase
MKILADISHPAHINFFKHALEILQNEGHEVMITGLRRGKLPRILEKEMSMFPVHYVGSHHGNKYSIIVDANLKKAVNLFRFVKKHTPDIGISVGSFNLGAVLKLFGKPNLQFDDDPERPVNVFLEKLTSSSLYFPPIVESNGKVKTMNALKEWAYLTPKYFKPNIKAIAGYPVTPGNYIFVREVSTGSLNYEGQQANLIASIANEFPRNYKVLLSLEDKSTIKQYPAEWILLEEPINDIHSLMYYSKMVVSSGDSMAREGAMLGVPALYCGFREMLANNLLIDRKMLYKTNPAEVPAQIKSVISRESEFNQEDFRNKLFKEWDDITQFIIENIKAHVSEDKKETIVN